MDHLTRAFLVMLLLVISASPSSAAGEGDQEFAQLQYAAAETSYLSALATSADSAEILWKLARTNVCMADVAGEGQKLELYRRAEMFAARCISADSASSEGHAWRAAALGNIAVFEGSKTKVRLCNVIKAELDESIRLKPDNDIAYSILGSFYMALGNVGWLERRLAAIFLGSLPDGGYADAERALQKAIAISPRVIRHHAALGELYVQEDRTEEALVEFRQVVSLTVLLVRDRRDQSLAAEFIQKFDGKATRL
jgi:tetratricopeptide (TPR) repeat protein